MVCRAKLFNKMSITVLIEEHLSKPTQFGKTLKLIGTCAISGRSGTNLTMAIPHPEIIQMLRKLGSRVIHKYRLQICNQISHTNNQILSKVTANILNFIYSAITIDVWDPN